MAYSLKYGHITTEHGDIAEDEPVFIIRAQDKLAPEVLKHYLTMCQREGSPHGHIIGIIENIDVMEKWQREHFTKRPSSKFE